MTDVPFHRRIAAAGTAAGARAWVYVPYDQLSDEVGPVARRAPEATGIVMIESAWKAARRPYHKQKLALVLANQRHFALEQAARGVAVDYVFTDKPYEVALREVAARRGPLEVMRPAERELRHALAPLFDEALLREVPHEGWLTTREDFAAAGDGPPWRMDRFYRHVRRAYDVLMEDGKPVGGKLSFDAENRKPWKGTPSAPEPPRYEPDAVTREVGDLVSKRFADHPGTLDLTRLPATRTDAERTWTWAQRACLEHFGPYEDAMSSSARGLFHTRMAALLNLHRIAPRRVVEEAIDADVPLASKEGFVRQVLGWREFVHHVHEATDGFRALPDTPLRDGLAAPAHLDATRPLPAAWWDAPSGLACLDDVVRAVWEEGWTHHIPRLMVLSNIATLLGVDARELTDWFWVAYVDAYDWVVEPNVLAMGTFATGDVMTTKPYVSGAAYIHRMSDHCAGCAFHPKTTCPLTPLYWHFLARNAEHLAANQRMRMPLASLRKRAPEKRQQDAAMFEHVWAALQRGARVAAEVDGDRPA